MISPGLSGPGVKVSGELYLSGVKLKDTILIYNEFSWFIRSKVSRELYHLFPVYPG